MEHIQLLSRVSQTKLAVFHKTPLYEVTSPNSKPAQAQSAHKHNIYNTSHAKYVNFSQTQVDNWEHDQYLMMANK